MILLRCFSNRILNQVLNFPSFSILKFVNLNKKYRIYLLLISGRKNKWILVKTIYLGKFHRSQLACTLYRGRYKIFRYKFNPANIYMFQDNNRNTRHRCEISSKLTIKTTKRRRRRSGVFIVNIEPILHLCLVFLLLTWNK